MAKKVISKKNAAPARKASSPPVTKVKKPVRPIAKAAVTASKSAPAKAKPTTRPAGATVPMKPVLKPPKKVKSPLNKTELEEFRQVLLEKRKAILGDMSSIEADALRTNRQDGSGDLSNMPTHPADIGSDNFEQEFTLGLLDSERKLLSEINAALERIDAGTFGVCLGAGCGCDDTIGLARLRARPWAKYCIQYAKMLEKGLVPPEREQLPAAAEDDEDEDDTSPAESDADESESDDEEDNFGQEDTED